MNRIGRAKVEDGFDGAGTPEGRLNLALGTDSPASIAPGGRAIPDRPTQPGEAAGSGAGGVGPVRAVKERRAGQKQAMDPACLFGAERHGRM